MVEVHEWQILAPGHHREGLGVGTCSVSANLPRQDLPPLEPLTPVCRRHMSAPTPRAICRSDGSIALA
ncbi:hypothetical protein ACKKBG_A19500 [Auxenochlorella protothecoides x Auxenochlorella symbiontica]